MRNSYMRSYEHHTLSFSYSTDGWCVVATQSAQFILRRQQLAQSAGAEIYAVRLHFEPAGMH